MKKPILSIIILNYNTKDLLKDCLTSLIKRQDEADFEIIVVDNGSTDDSLNYIDKLKTQKEFSQFLTVIKNYENLGFASGNNKAKKIVKGDYVLFLNSDTLVHKDTLKKTLDYLKKNSKVGALTCKIILPDGSLDRDSRRSFITPWIGLTHLYLQLDKLFPKSKLFGKYWYGYKSEDEMHEVDVIQGAYFLVRKSVLDQVDWFDEDYFLDGEDIDLCWKIKKVGWKIIYFPEVSITHIKGATKGKNASRLKKGNRDIKLSEKIRYKLSGVNSMELFVRKRLWNEYPKPFLYFVIFGIKLLKLIRIFRLLIKG